MPPKRPPHLAALLASAAALTVAAPAFAPLFAQSPVVLLASPAEQRERLALVQGLDSTDGFLLRSLGQRLARENHRNRISASVSSGATRFQSLGPTLSYVYNSAHPWGWNDGPSHAARGGNATLSGGVVVRQFGVTLQIVPQVVYESNLYVPVIPYGTNQTPSRNVWANPFHPPPESIDAPLRFGSDPRLALRGQHRLAFDAPASLAVGLSTENRWWGPGVRNALVLGSQGPGFGHAFVESREPWRTRLGDFEAQYVLGVLRESRYFDADKSNDRRSLSAAAVTWRPPEGLDALLPEIGLSRAVMATGAPGLENALDFLRDVGRPFADSADATRGRDQITALFARWLIPHVGLEAWLEWARYEQPVNLRDLLVNPGHSQGYTLGLSWAQPYRGGVLQSQAEFTYVEPSASIRVRPVGASYTSASVPQGWTHEGELIGPAVGQAGSSQWLSFDWFREERLSQMGISFGRLRRDNGEPFESPQLSFRREDISLWVTLRAGWRIGPLDALVEFTDAARLNYLFQAFDRPPEEGGWAGVDLHNQTLSLTLSPRRR